MNQVTPEEKDGLTKTFAIVGFLVLVIFIVWLAVQIVSIIPSAFSSLASLADSVYNYNQKEELVVSNGENVINAGQSFTIQWTEMRKPGVYTFSYACVDGVSVDVRNTGGDIVALACDTPFAVGEATTLEVLIASEKSRFVDVPYTITYVEEGNDASSLATNKTITIVNATIPASGAIVENTPEVVTPAPTTPKPTTPTYVAPKPTTPTYTAGTPTTISKVVYAIPTSDPKGTIDLQVTYLGVGYLNGTTFIASPTIDADSKGAIQFEVKNIGTKTAEDWSYEANLPASITYKSGDQKALKPNERAIITLGFEGITKTGTEDFDVEVTAKGDVKNSNNSFDKTVRIVD